MNRKEAESKGISFIGFLLIKIGVLRFNKEGDERVRVLHPIGALFIGILLLISPLIAMFSDGTLPELVNESCDLIVLW